MDKKGSFKAIFVVMLLTLAIALLWEKYSFIKNNVHSLLDPTLGIFLNWNLTIGMTIVVLAIAVITTLVQKYATDQETLREIKREQKILQEEMKKYKEHPEKVAELSKKQFETMAQVMPLTMRPIIYTGVPFVLLFRWFMDYFSTPALEGFRFFGFLSWFWFYLIVTIIFSSILRKVLKVA